MEIHTEMLADKPRKEAYELTCLKECPNMIVLDVGTGTGAIAM
jgi:ubiquinone/menaquinone biosynthesis C-methylase UbiE